MSKSLCLSVALGFSVALGSQCKNASAGPNRFIQDRFAIGFWVDPPIGDDADFRYKEIADANFTVVLGGFLNAEEVLLLATFDLLDANTQEVQITVQLIRAPLEP